MTTVPTATLNNGVDIPQLGFGVFQIPPDQTKQATLTALDVGYRHIDTAEMYRNERQVGEAIREFGIPRGEVFVTSKLNNRYHAHDDALKAFEQTLDDLGFEYLDLFLIHWPLPGVGDYVGTWAAMVEMLQGGRVRAIGVSNFQPAHLQRVLDASEVVPAVNQVEIHPYFIQDDLRAFNTEHEIVTEAWAPLAEGRVLTDPTINRIADKIGRTPAQTTLRWHIQRGDIVFPKSVTRSRVEENFAIFDFELSDDDMDEITSLNRNQRNGLDPDTNNDINA
jgi:2,5-diketo-D-gluconate reductase A